jgi:hypothetical protein
MRHGLSISALARDYILAGPSWRLEKRYRGKRAYRSSIYCL